MEGLAKLIVLCVCLGVYLPHVALSASDFKTDLSLQRFRKFLKDKYAARITLFGPTNAAFNALSPAVRNTLDNNAPAAVAIMSYHAVSREVLSRDLTNEMLLPSMLHGLPIRINVYPNTNTITASGRPVTLVDQPANNGVLHELSDIMLPPGGSLTDVLSEVPDLNTLLKAVTTAGLGDMLTGQGPYTVFAPADEAFDALPAGELERLLKNPTMLKQLLMYHVLSGTVYSAGLSPLQKIPSLDNGRNLTIRNSGNGVTVNAAKVIYADLSATNGVVHLINTVLRPPNMSSLDHLA
nr:hypothetical protein BaRGS_006322 [Batillaria attramentaria]